MRTKYSIILICLLLIVGCAPQPAPVQQEEQIPKLSVATTFFPLYELTRMVAQDKGEVFSIVPISAEPHSFIPTPQDFVRLSKADVFVTLGVEFEEFEEELIESVENLPLIPAGAGITIIELEEHEEHKDHEKEHGEHKEEDHDEHEGEHDSHEEHDKHEEHKEEGHDEHTEEDHHEHDHGGKDPHIWLSPKNAIIMVQNIANGLKNADPQHAGAYDTNANAAIQQLSALDEEYRVGLANCNKDTILVTHNAYSYLGADYGFQTIEISGLSPEAEPTPKQIARLIDEAEEHQLKYIFYEELVDPRVSNTIAAQVGAQTLSLNPVAGTKEGGTYVSIMQDNLANLRLAMEC